MSATPLWVYPLRDDPLFEHLAIRSSNGVFHHRKKDPRTRQYKPVSLRTRELDVARAAYLEHAGEPVVADRTMTVDKAFDKLVDRLEKRGRKPSTIARYKTAYKNDIKPEIGHRTVVSITAADVLAVIDKAKARTKLKGGGNKAVAKPTKEIDPVTGKPAKVGKSGIYQVHATMSTLFTFCAQPTNGWRLDNPSALLGEDKPALPPITAVPAELVFNEQEVDLIAEGMGEGTWLQFQRKTLVLLSPEFGTRINELLACALEDAVLPLEVAGQSGKTGRLHLRRQLAFDRVAADPSTWFDTLKGENERIGDKKRVVPVSAFSVGVLRRYIARGKAEGRLRPGGLLFPNSQNRPLCSSRLSKHLRKRGEELGRTVRSHYFRHTYASTLISRGTSLENAAAFLGHDPKMTKDRYGHFNPDDTVFEEVGAVLRQPKEATS